MASYHSGGWSNSSYRQPPAQHYQQHYPPQQHYQSSHHSSYQQPPPRQSDSRSEKRPASNPPRSDGSSKQQKSGGATASAYTVLTKGNDASDPQIRTLVGTYEAAGDNHGRGVFRKVRSKNTDKPDRPEEVDVWLYYWDTRDGPKFEGWWFGNKVGGDRVWSQCLDSGYSPPTTGWKIPWDGPVRSTLVIEPGGSGSGARVVAPPSKPTAENNATLQWAQQAWGNWYQQPPEMKLQTVSALIAATEVQLNLGLTEAHTLLNEGSPASLARVAELLNPQQEVLGDALNRVAEVIRSGATSGVVLKGFTDLQARVKVLHASVQKKTSLADKSKLDPTLETMLGDAREKLNHAEEMATQAKAAGDVVITQDQAAVTEDQTKAAETAVEAAQKAVDDARAFLNAKLPEIRALGNTVARQRGQDEFSRLQRMLNASQAKIGPLKDLKEAQRLAGVAQEKRKQMEDRLQKGEDACDSAEVECSKVVGEEGTQHVASANKAVATAEQLLSGTLSAFDEQLRGAKGSVRVSLQELMPRARAMQERLKKLKEEMKANADKATMDAILKGSMDRVTAAGMSVVKLQEAENTVMLKEGTSGEAPLNEVLEAVCAFDDACAAAQLATSQARMFLITKLAEGKRLGAECAEKVTNELKKMQEELGPHLNILKECKDKPREFAHASIAVLREAMDRVRKAEADVDQAVMEAAVFTTDGADKMTPEEVYLARNKHTAADRKATTALVEARKFVLTKQMEENRRTGLEKGKENEVIVELKKLQTRLSDAKNKLAAKKAIVDSAESRRTVTSSCPELEKKLEAAQEKFDAAKTVVQNALDVEKEGKDEVKDAEGEKKAKIPVEAALAGSKHYLSIASAFMTTLVQKCGGVELPPALAELKTKQEKLSGEVKEMVSSWRERFDGPLVKEMLSEGDQIVKEFEQSLEDAIDAEKRINDSSDEDLVTNISAAEEAIESTESLLTYAQEFLNDKMVKTIKLSPNPQETAKSGLADIQRRVTEALTKVTDLKNSLVESQKKCGGRQAELVVKGAESKAEVAEAALKVFDDHTEDTNPDEVSKAVQEAAIAQGEVDAAIVKAMTIAQNMEESADRDSLFARIQKLDEKLVEQRGILTNKEHGFVAKKMGVQMGAKAEEAEKKLQGALDIAEPLVISKDNFVAASAIGHIVEALKRFMTAEKKSSGDLFEALCTKKADSKDKKGKGKASKSQFASYLQEEIPELKVMPTLRFTEKELSLVFNHVDEDNDGLISSEDFGKQFLGQYECVKEVSMTEELEVTGKPKRKLLLGEVVMGQEEPTKDAKVGLDRVRVKATDGEEGWVTIAGNQGTVFMKALAPFDHSVQEAEKGLTTAQTESEKTIGVITTRLESLDGIDEGPLVDAKAQLEKMLQKLQEVHERCEKTKKELAKSQAARVARLKAEGRWEVEKEDREAASEMVDPATKEMEELEQETDEIAEAAEKLSTDFDKEDRPFDVLDKLQVRAKAVEEKLVTVGKSILDYITKCKDAKEGPLLEAKQKLLKLRTKVAPVTTKCRNALKTLATTSQGARGAANTALFDVLRLHLQTKKLSPEKFFQQLGPVAAATDADAPELGPRIPMAKLEKAASGLKASKDGEALSSKTLSFALRPFVDKGVSKSWICTWLTEYRVCVKEIAVTNTLDVGKGTRTLRKLKVGEIVEILETPSPDEGEAAKVERIKARTISDAIEGWVTVKGNQGTVFLEGAPKPYMIVGKEAALRAEEKSGSSVVRNLSKNEVVEVLEGPRQETASQAKRAKGKLADGTVGWVTFSADKGAEHFSPAKDAILQAKQNTVIMDEQDVTKGKSLRKIDTGEAVQVLEGPLEDGDRGIIRARGKCLKDGLEGWVTIKGNQGTVYLQTNDKYYLCTVEGGTSLQAEMASDSAEVKTIQNGDFFQVTDGPKAEPHTAKERVKVMALKDDASGWLTVQEAQATYWEDPGT